MNSIECLPAVRKSDFSTLQACELPLSRDDAEFFAAVEVGQPIKFRMPMSPTVADLRERLLNLSRKIGRDFVVHAIEDAYGGRYEFAVVIKLDGMTHGGRIRKAVADAMLPAAQGEILMFLRPSGDTDVFFHIITALEEVSDATGDIIGWCSEDGRRVAAKRIANDDEGRALMQSRADGRLWKFIRPESSRMVGYHGLGVGQACDIAYDGTKGRETSIRVTVSAYGRRNNKKFSVNKGNGVLVVTRTA